jgi:hypothetical protein
LACPYGEYGNTGKSTAEPVVSSDDNIPLAGGPAFLIACAMSFAHFAKSLP